MAKKSPEGSLPPVKIAIQQFDGLEFYLSNLLLQPPALSSATDISVITNNFIGWDSKSLVQILTPRSGQPQARFLFHAPNTGLVYPYLSVSASDRPFGSKGVKYIKVGGGDGKLGIQISSFTDFGSAFTHVVADTKDAKSPLFQKTLVSVGGRRVYSYNHEELINLLRSAPKPLNVGYI